MVASISIYMCNVEEGFGPLGGLAPERLSLGMGEMGKSKKQNSSEARGQGALEHLCSCSACTSSRSK